MPSFRLDSPRRRLLPLIPALIVLSLFAPPAHAEEGPYTLAGDGMTVVVTSESNGGLKSRGTMRVTTSQAWPYESELTQNPDGSYSGRGVVAAGQRRIPFTIRVVAEGRVDVTLAGKTYQLARVVTAPSAPITPTPGPTPTATTIRLQPQRLFDPKMVSGGMDSHTLYAPEGWQVTGGAYHVSSQRLFNVVPSQHIRIAAPDGREVYIAPSIPYIERTIQGRSAPVGQALEGYPVGRMPRNYSELGQRVAETFIPNAFPGASHVQVQGIARIPELRNILDASFADLRRQHAGANASGAAYGMSVWLECDVVGIKGEFTQAGTRYQFLRILGFAWSGNKGPGVFNQLWEVVGDITYKARAGQLERELPLLRSISQSVKETPAWAAKRTELLVTLLKIRRDLVQKTIREWRRRSQLVAITGEEIRRMHRDSSAKREALWDKTHAQVIRIIREQSIVKLPGSNITVEVPNAYRRVYANASSHLIVSTDPEYNPGPGWTRLTRHP